MMEMYYKSRRIEPLSTKDINALLALRYVRVCTAISCDQNSGRVLVKKPHV